MKLVFLHGTPGVGKLTVARELAALTGFKVFHNHLTVDLVGAVFEFGSKPFVELRERIWLDVFAEAARDGLSGLIFTFAFEPTVRPDFIERVKQTAADNGAEVLFVKLTCSDDELEKRLVHPTRRLFGKLTDLGMFRDLRAAGTFVDPEVVSNQLVIDTTSITPVEAAAQILRELQLAK